MQPTNKEFYFILMDGRGQGWVYAHKFKMIVYSSVLNAFGLYNKVIFYRNGAECLTLDNVDSVAESETEILWDEKP